MNERHPQKTQAERQLALLAQHRVLRNGPHGRAGDRGVTVGLHVRNVAGSGRKSAAPVVDDVGPAVWRPDGADFRAPLPQRAGGVHAMQRNNKNIGARK